MQALQIRSRSAADPQQIYKLHRFLRTAESHSHVAKKLELYGSLEII
jgi:hypothetical protein